jgi:hypothetical protein
MKVKQAVIGILVLGLLVWLAPAAHTVDGSFTIGSGRTDDKPQSKLWFNDGTWWAILGDGADIYFFRLTNGVFVKQTFPNAMVDTSISARADVLWTDPFLFVLLYKGSTVSLSKYSYDAPTQTYTRLPGFPVSLPLASGSESATIAQDSTGKLWIVYDPGNKIRVMWSTTSDHTGWNTTGMVLYEPVDSDDLADIVAFNNRIGVMWSNQSADNFGFRIHVDGQPETTWGPVEVVEQGGSIADDHVNLAVTDAQDVLAATKSSVSGDQINLFVRWHNSGWGGPYFIIDHATRPIVVFDRTNQDVYVFYTDWSVSTQAGKISYKKANLSTLIDLAVGQEIEFMAVSGANLNDVTSTRQAVDATTGLLVVAKAGSTAYYKSLELLPGAGNLPPEVHAGVNQTITLPASAVLDGTVNDDGQLLATPTVRWSQVSGPGTVTFANASAVDTTAAFSMVGTYILRLTANDGEATVSDETTITVLDGNGSSGSVTHQETQTGGASNTTTVTTAASLTGVSGDLYLVAIATKPYVAVSTVSGLGLSWTLVQAQCGGRSQTGVTVWMALGVPSGNGSVTATLAKVTGNAVITVSRYSGVNIAAPLGNVMSGNTVGINGACSGGTDTAAYALTLPMTVDSAVVYGAVAIRNRTHTPGTGYTEQAEIHQGSGGDMAGLAVEGNPVAVAAPVTVNGLFSNSVDWAIVAVEIKPQ